MKMNGYSFALTLLLLIALTVLGYLASQGSLAAAVILAVLGTVTLILMGVVIALTAVRMTDVREHKQHLAHSKQQLNEAYQLQSLLTAQNKQLWEQSQRQAALPEPGHDPQVITIDESLFEDFED